jgi:glyoxylase I family protein
MITGIHHVSMKCTAEEYPRVHVFYSELLGLSVEHEWTGGVMYRCGNCLIEIFNDQPGIREKGAVRHFAFCCDTVDETVKKLEEAGYECFVAPKEIILDSKPEVRARIAFVKGPVGEEIELFDEH